MENVTFSSPRKKCKCTDHHQVNETVNIFQLIHTVELWNQYCVLDDESERKGEKEKKDARFKHNVLHKKKCNGIFFSVAGFYCEWNFFFSIFVVVVSDDTAIVVALQIRRVSTLWLKSEQKCHAYMSVENLRNGFLFIVRDMCGTLTNCDCVLLSVSRVICVWIVPFMKWKIFRKKRE